MSRQESAYQIYYSHLLHRPFGILAGRIDKSMTFILLLLGSSVMASIGDPVAVGFIIATIASMQTAFKPAALSESARMQSIKYLNLFARTETLSDEQILSQITETQDNDCPVWGTIENIAEYRADITLKGYSGIN